MPYYQAPRSDSARLKFLAKSLQAARHDRRVDNTYLPPALEEEVADLLPIFDAALKTLKVHQSERSQQVETRNAALERLKTYLRDFWEVLKRRVERLDQPSSLLEIYGLPTDGKVPKLTTYESWLNAAADAVQGDVEATTLGYEPMINPSAEELRTVLDKVYQQTAQVAAAERTYEKSLETVNSLREDVDRLIKDIVETLRFKLRKKSAAEQRRILHLYGARFRYRKGETSEYRRQTTR
jgi:hypothetical protein